MKVTGRFHGILEVKGDVGEVKGDVGGWCGGVWCGGRP